MTSVQLNPRTVTVVLNTFALFREEEGEYTTTLHLTLDEADELSAALEKALYEAQH